MSQSESAHLAITIRRPPDEVYAYVRAPQNLPKWAAGLSGSIEQREGIWWATSPLGQVQVRFVESNSYGVADHFVTLPDGQEVLNPMRVLEHPEGSEVLFSLFRSAEMSAEDFKNDQQTVQKDLATLKRVLEEA